MKFLEEIEKNLAFVDTFAKLESVFEQFKGKNIRIAYSGGSDSDTVMHLVKLMGYDVIGVFYDTGLEYGLPFKVSNKCCEGAKKLPVKKYAKENKVDLFLMGIRKAEGGIRAGNYKNCFVLKNSYSYSMYFPLFWWKKEDKELFDKIMNIKHSDAYSVYGLKRTGCVACPFGRKFEEELKVVKEFEPRLDKGINSIFGKSFEWTRKYNEFKNNLQ